MVDTYSRNKWNFSFDVINDVSITKYVSHGCRNCCQDEAGPKMLDFCLNYVSTHENCVAYLFEHGLLRTQSICDNSGREKGAQQIEPEYSKHGETSMQLFPKK